MGAGIFNNNNNNNNNNKENEIQSFTAKETISTENPNLVSPNMDFEDDRSNDDDAKVPVQGRVGKNTTPVVQNQREVEENPEEDEVLLPREKEIVAHRNDMDYATLST